MPRPCTICTDSRHRKIDEEILLGKPLSKIARKYAISDDCLQRHKSHVGDNYAAKIKAKLLEKNVGAKSDDILGQIEELRKDAGTLWDKAETVRDSVLVLRERIRIVEVLDRLLERARVAQLETRETDLAHQLDRMTPEQLEALVTGSEWQK